jgi:hypothetical protein
VRQRGAESVSGCQIQNPKPKTLSPKS